MQTSLNHTHPYCWTITTLDCVMSTLLIFADENTNELDSAWVFVCCYKIIWSAYANCLLSCPWCYINLQNQSTDLDQIDIDWISKVNGVKKAHGWIFFSKRRGKEQKQARVFIQWIVGHEYLRTYASVSSCSVSYQDAASWVSLRNVIEWRVIEETPRLRKIASIAWSLVKHPRRLREVSGTIWRRVTKRLKQRSVKI